jgi:hypothetical protein
MTNAALAVDVEAEDAYHLDLPELAASAEDTWTERTEVDILSDWGEVRPAESDAGEGVGQQESMWDAELLELAARAATFSWPDASSVGTREGGREIVPG